MLSAASVERLLERTVESTLNNRYEILLIVPNSREGLPFYLALVSCKLSLSNIDICLAERLQHETNSRCPCKVRRQCDSRLQDSRESSSPS